MRSALLLLALFTPGVAAAQDHGAHPMAMPEPTTAPVVAQDHAGMDHAAGDSAPQAHDMADHDMAAMPAMAMGGNANAVAGSGTALVPRAESAMPMLHLASGEWTVMAHGTIWGVYTDQGGPRGDDKAFVESMAMLMASRDFGGARLQLRSMMSLEPAMGARGYPNLFASGETAGGEPLVDRQHPHDLFMELAARVDVDIADGASAFAYGGPVGEPALGPSAFMHRRSARYLALSPIAHHWFDSTHITYGVATIGVTARRFQIEASAFNGREPDEARWGIDTPQLDSWSIRATFTPSPNWTMQVSHGRLEQPEAAHAGQDERRTTASAHYARGGFAAMVAFAAKERVPGDTLTAWLGEANWDLGRHHSLFGRIENVANHELFPDHDSPLHDRRFRVTRFEGGYAYRIPLGWGELALGGSLAAYAKPKALSPPYGKAPLSATGFARLAIGN